MVQSSSLSSILLVTAAIVLFSLVLRTVSPSIAGGDSGELVAEGCILGTAHPPGYPLFTLLVYGIKRVHDYAQEHLFDDSAKAAAAAAAGGGGADTADSAAAPSLGSMAYQVNLFSAALTVAAAYCIGQIVQLGTTTSSPSSKFLLGGPLLAMGLFTFSPLIWQYAVTAEVFPLNTFFASLLLLLVLVFARTGQYSVALLGAFVCGLALCNQHTIVLYEAPLILWMFFLLRRRIYASPIITCLQLGLSFLAGLLPYAYLPIAATLQPQHGSWGHVSTLEGFLHHFLRKDYGTFKLFSGAQGNDTEGLWVRTEAYLKDATFVQGLYVAPALALVAILSWHRVISAEAPIAPALTPAIPPLSSLETEGDKPEPTDGPGSQRAPATSETDSAVAALGEPKSSKKDKKKQQQVSAAVTPAGGKANKNSAKASTTTAALIGPCCVSPAEANLTPLIFLATQLFYFGIFHTLANLPLGNKLLYGIHQRFWMQPNVLLFTWAGVGYNQIFAGFLAAASWITGANATDKKKKEKARAASSSFSSYLTFFFSIVNIAGAVALVFFQHQKWHFVSDQSAALHWKNYASAILDGLPEKAVLLINYDMQWTAVRYLQKCEGFRSDVIAINLSMMTYTWFHQKRKLYPSLTFPGTYLGQANVAAHVRNQAFTLKSFLDANTPSHPIYLGGKVNYPDPELDITYSFIPAGLVSKIVPLAASPNGTVYNRWNQINWVHVVRHLATLPDMRKYPEETWEWTINRDFRDRVMDTAAYLLESAIKTAAVDPQPLIDAVYWLETAVLLEQTGPCEDETKTPGHNCFRPNLNAVPAALLKNAGLGHVYLVQSKALNSSAPLVFSYDFFQSGRVIRWPAPGSDWKLWAADQFAMYWGAFIEMPDAKRDPQYDVIKKTYIAATTKPADK